MVSAGALAAAGLVGAASRLATRGKSWGGAVPVAFLIDEGVTVIDFTGPWEVLQDAQIAGVPGFELFTVAPTTDVLRGTGGLQIKPDYSLADAPPARVIIIPAQSGGRGSGGVDNKLEWLRSRFASTDIIMSVCTGAYLLARTGLLDGHSATTHHDFVADLAERFPKIKVLSSMRFVDNGRLITAGGLSSGIEGALHLVSRFYGAEAAHSVAEYMEYVPQKWSA